MALAQPTVTRVQIIIIIIIILFCSRLQCIVGTTCIANVYVKAGFHFVRYFGSEVLANAMQSGHVEEGHCYFT